jgi:hypothetical protein
MAGDLNQVVQLLDATLKPAERRQGKFKPNVQIFSMVFGRTEEALCNLLTRQ